jgi:outer membrane protein TolC
MMQTHSKYKLISWLRKRNRQRNKIILVLGFLLLLMTLVKLTAAQDGSLNKTLSPEEVISIVKQYHPVSRMADINIDKAKAELTIARGGFDPQLYSSNARKTFDGTDYYNYNRPELNIPTWFGVNISAGLEYLSGSRTDPQETAGKTSYFGLSVPLAKNLLMDKRRAALQTAKIYKEASLVEKKVMLNDLLRESMTSYWEWFLDYQVLNILKEAVNINRQRVEFIKTSVRLGERPGIDTIEAIAQLQNFELQFSQAELEFGNAGLALSAFLWTSDQQPYTLPGDIIPASLPAYQDWSIPSLDSLLQQARLNHPELRLYSYKLEALSVDKKLKFQEILPAINFTYHQLGKGYDLLKTATGPLYENNFRYGFSAGIPLRFSAGRGEYKKAKLKITEAETERNYKQLLVETKVRSYYNELLSLRQQLILQENNYKNYRLLLQGEETRFKNGESSLFLVNARENKTLEGLQKLQELRSKYFKTINLLSWSAGQLL